MKRNKSSEAFLNHKKERRKLHQRFGTPSSIILDSPSLSELSFEGASGIGNAMAAGGGTGANTLQQSRLSRFSPEKSKILYEEDV